MILKSAAATQALGAIGAALKAVTGTLLQEPGATPWRSRAVGKHKLHILEHVV